MFCNWQNIENHLSALNLSQSRMQRHCLITWVIGYSFDQSNCFIFQRFYAPFLNNYVSVVQEYSSNLRSSGVFGGLLVLNNSFGPEEFAQCLNIPEEKTAIRKHLVGELSSLMINARYSCLAIYCNL